MQQSDANRARGLQAIPYSDVEAHQWVEAFKRERRNHNRTLRRLYLTASALVIVSGLYLYQLLSRIVER